MQQPHAAQLTQALLARIEQGAHTGSLPLCELIDVARHFGGVDAAPPWPLAQVPLALERLGPLPPVIEAVALLPADCADAWPPGADPATTLRIRIRGGLPDVVASALALLMVVLSARQARADASAGLQALAEPDFNPTLWVHPDLSQDACHSRGRQQGRALLGLLAEMGLASRPWHLWVGPRAPVALLSPYVRDLGDALARWGAALPNVGAPEDHPAARYAIADAFVASHVDLAQERAEADRTVGIISARVHKLEAHIVDLGRCLPDLWDPRLPPRNVWQPRPDAPHPAPLLVHIPYTAPGLDERTLSALLARLSQSVGATLQSLTVCLPGHLADARAPQLTLGGMLCAAGGWPLPAASSQGALGARAAPYAEAVPWRHEDREWLGWATGQPADDEPMAPAAVVGGGGVLWAKVLRLMHTGAFSSAMTARLHVYDDRHALTASDALALEFLQQLGRQGGLATAAKPGKAMGLRV